MFLIFDLDMTLVNSSIADQLRQQRVWQQVYHLIPQFTLFDGITELMATLERHDIQYGIVTASPRTYCEKVVEHFNFKPKFCVCYHDTQRHKPHPDPIRYAVGQLPHSDEYILSLGDRDIDIHASNQAGVMSVACLWGAKEKQALKRASPDFMIHHPYEVLHVIEMINTITD